MIPNAIREKLFRKHLAYCRCFLDDKGELTDAAKIVLQDLARFSGYGTTPTVVSPVSRQTDVPATMQRVGRMDTLNRVWKFLRMPVNKIADVVGYDED
jgi:hypothetical protein